MKNNLDRIKSFNWNGYINKRLEIYDIKLLAKKIGIINENAEYSHKLMVRLLEDNFIYMMNNSNEGYHHYYISEFNADKYASKRRLVPLTRIVQNICKKTNISDVEKRIVDIWRLRYRAGKQDISWMFIQ